MIGITLGPRIKQYAVVIVANLSIIHLGISVSWSSPVIVKLMDKNTTTLSRVLTDAEVSWMSSISPLAAILICFMTTLVLDGIGRKKCLLFVSVLRVTGILMFMFGKEVWILLLARAVSGMSDCFYLAALTTYTSEIASKEIRGALGTITQISSGIGQMIILTIGPFVSYNTLHIIWLCIVVVVTIPVFVLPETPYYLYVTGNEEKSLKVLTFLRSSETLAKEEAKEYSDSTKDNKIRTIDLIKDKTVIKTIGKVIFLAVELQLMGLNALTFYLQPIFQSTNTNIPPEICSVAIGCTQVVGCIVTILLTDKYGRKPVLTFSLLGCSIGMISLGVFFKLIEQNHTVNGFLNVLPLLSIMVYIFCFNSGMGPLFWPLVAELFEGPARAIGVTTGVFVTSTFVFLVTKFFGQVTLIVGPAPTYWFFAANCLLVWIFIMYFVPETKGKSFAEIQKALGTNDKKTVDSVNKDCFFFISICC
ncbi:hypothetical protein K1T71_013500 [Dendrolimus kikuchii]|uniref:Uncharacterized protein n=1 Tax=Dendrolimus kikuchii TaxID=765133 RepID=A0ACC1CGU1_9NEOP|nr:hypothetical protein K1T71_013500 [Dendrolimus kikuchii]